MSKDRLLKLLEDISRVKIAVIGDFCLDAYWIIDESTSEISVETGKATHPVSVQRYSPGGAGNVTANLAALGAGEVHAFGVIGTDPFGREMVRALNESGIITENLLCQKKDWHTHTYSKPYIGGNELNRIDFGNFNKLSEQTAGLLVGNLVKKIPGLDLVIINQQVPSGINTEYFRKKLVEVVKSFPEKLFITDSRSFNDYYSGTIRKMNDSEALRLCGKIMKPDEPVPVSDLKAAASELYKRFSKPLFITRGAKGSIIVNENGITEIPGLLILNKTDTVGAGDSYLAGAAAAMAAGYTMEEAASLGTHVAGVTVQKLFQTGTATPAEITAIGSDPDFVFEPDLAEDRRKAVYFENTEIEIIRKWNKKPRILHAIFDHDGTISTMRQGWEQIMAPMMIKAVFGDKLNEADDREFRTVKKRVDEFIDRTTGIQTLVQMHGLIDIIREFGYVPANRILDAPGYKKIYNDELLLMVREREYKFRRGELGIEDLTLKNAVKFLEIMHDARIKLYLASGTDVEDVLSEAKVLGYDHLFEGRIFGSVGDITKDAKKIVLDHILDIIGTQSSGSVVTFGDGPVEIRETKKRGGLTVGVASDEIRRFGLNLQKRERLVKAGSDIIIPDFSQHNAIVQLLNL
ncbi:MAG TPA: PfkB family carbohydrate kinase [Bacteroidales bacterium]|nr:PfkB family carbohydrate kinase [Bacteroidales bacterium]